MIETVIESTNVHELLSKFDDMEPNATEQIDPRLLFQRFKKDEDSHTGEDAEERKNEEKEPVDQPID